MPIAAQPDDITNEQVQGWFERFRFYRASPSVAQIGEWLLRFAEADRGVAAKVLDNVVIISEPDIHEGYRRSLALVPGWRRRSRDRQGRWFFVGFGTAGESGNAMVRPFREANGMASSNYDGMFVTLAELVGLRLTAFDTVVFIDDFSGTGQQAVRRWPTYQELVASEASCYLILSAVTEEAKERINALDQLSVIADRVLGADCDVMTAGNPTLTEGEQVRLLPYCIRADRQNPRGYGNCGLLLVLSHRTPNNSLPILHANHPRWQGLFPRYLQVAA
jgi:hypothetical protein